MSRGHDGEINLLNSAIAIGNGRQRNSRHHHSAVDKWVMRHRQPYRIDWENRLIKETAKKMLIYKL